MISSIAKIRFVLIGLSISALLAACGGQQEVVTTEEVAMGAEPTEVIQDSIPGGLVQVAVPDRAYETRDALYAAEHPERDYYRLAEELAGFDPALLEQDLPNWQDLAVNDRDNFIINANLGGDYQSVPTRVRLITENSVWWADVSVTLSDEQIAQAADILETEVLPLLHLAFGKEWSPGIDGDPRIHILLVNEERWGGFFGYFSAINEYPTVLRSISNQRELIVLNSNAISFNASTGFSPGMSHELLHLIHWNKDHNEDLWLNESFSELARYLAGASVESAGATGPTNASVFSQNSDFQLTSRPELKLGDEDLTVFGHYAAEKYWSIYLFEHFGPQFIRDLFNNPDPGVISIRKELAKLDSSPEFDEVFANWLVANLLDQPNLDQGQWGYAEYDVIRPQRIVINSFRGEPIHDQLPPYGAHYYELLAGGDVHVSFTGSTLARVTATDPATGNYAWYSNRGDESQFQLVRSFDLTEVSSATLNFKVWFELERLYDYGYVEISTDGGSRWTILETANGTDENPKNEAYGWGYTGSVVGWQDESIDLTPYVGGEVLIRFEVLNDFSTNRDGLMLDDIAIPEIGYFDGAEDDSGGWEAHGFIRSSNLVPNNWIVWVIKLTSPTTTVERITLDELQHADFTISGFGDEFPFAAIIVSPAAATTTIEQEYELILGSD